jgi:hypothetical protein
MPSTARARQAARSSGYELAGVAANSLAFLWPVSRTLLYRKLARLSALEWMEPITVQQTSVGRADDVAAARIRGRGRGFDAVPDEARIAEKQRIGVQRSQHLR